MNPLITVITICKNEVGFIEETILSVINQTYKNIEYIVVDELSNDGTLDVIYKYEDKINKIISEKNGGIYESMNKGISVSSGDFVIFLNGGDTYEKDTIQSLLDSYYASGCDFVSAVANKVTENKVNGWIGKMPYDESMNFGMSIRHELMLVPTWIYKNLIYDTKYRIVSDFDFSLKLFKQKFRFYEIPRPLLNFNTKGVSNTNFKKIHNEHFEIIKKNFPYLNYESLKILSNEQEINTKILEKVVEKYKNKKDLVKSIYLYSKRRLMSSSKIDNIYYNSFPTKVSIIVPVYNNEKINLLLESLISQTEKNIEIIIIDDASTDNTNKIISEYKIKDNRIKIHRNQFNQGVSFSRNIGINKAQGEFIFFADSDDYIPSDSIEKLYKASQEKNCYIDVVVGNIKIKGTERKKGLNIIKEEISNAYDNKNLTKTTENFLGSLYKTHLVKNILFDINLEMGEDSLFWINIILYARQIKLIKDIVYEYDSQNSESAMNNYTYKKYIDELNWRNKAFKLLKSASLKENSLYLVQDYWNESAFSKIKEILSEQEFEKFKLEFNLFVSDINISPIYKSKAIPKTNEMFMEILNKKNVAVLASNETDGAGMAATRMAKSIGADLYTKNNFFSTISYNQKYKNEKYSNTWFSILKNTRANYSIINQIENYDLINFHWCSDVISVELLKEICEIKTKVLLTLHDYWYFTGGCHYPAGCQKFKDGIGCHVCPQAKSQIQELNKNIYEKFIIKQEILRKPNVFISSPSKFIINEVAKSLNLEPNDNKFSVLRNPFDPSFDLNLNLKSKQINLIFVAKDLKEKRKGLDIALEALNSNELNDYDFILNIIGKNFNIKKINNSNISKKTKIHFINDFKDIEEIYAKSDFIISPSLEENWANVLVEAASYGCIPVVFPKHGSEEFVNEFCENKFVGNNLSSESLVEQIKRALSVPFDELRKQQKNMAIKVRECHSSNKIKKDYDVIYNKIIKTKGKKLDGIKVQIDPDIFYDEEKTIFKISFIKFKNFINDILYEKEVVVPLYDIDLFCKAINFILMYESLQIKVESIVHAGVQSGEKIKVLQNKRQMINKDNNFKLNKKSVLAIKIYHENKYGIPSIKITTKGHDLERFYEKYNLNEDFLKKQFKYNEN